MRATLTIFVLLFSQLAMAHPDHLDQPMPKEFETLKKLVGTWEGTAKMNGKDENVKVVYELSSGGTVITEKMMPGTPHEMISIYHREGKNLAMTHYCAIGNHPTMTLKKVDGTDLVFVMTKPTGISSMKEPHMHALTLKMPDNDTLEQDWVSYENGKPGEVAVFHYKRKS